MGLLLNFVAEVEAEEVGRLQVDLSARGIRSEVAAGRDPDGKGGADATLAPPDELAASTGMIAVAAAVLLVSSPLNTITTASSRMIVTTSTEACVRARSGAEK